ncbi:MAG TPA: hypothetical protein VFG09_04165 [Thermodesulfovibrionales bacterium]|jgi:N-acetylglucosamine-6-phosphate deacetylase|nr:hypothetical protein [Thermodesulfovibrionales bacterium]
MGLQGFIDLHAHGIGRYDTRTSDPLGILKIAELHGKAGTAAILPTIYSAPIPVMRQHMEAVRTAMAMQRRKRIEDSGYPITDRKGSSFVTHRASDILGVHLEGPFLNPQRCGALDEASFIRPALSALKKLIAGYEEIIRIITIAPELPNALTIIEKCAETGIIVSMGHSDATYQQGADGKKAGARGLTHIFNAMRPFHHREPGLAGFGLLDRDIYIEVIADGIHLHPETLKLIFSLKGHDRIVLVSDSVKGAKKGKPLYDSKGVLTGSGITIVGSVSVLRQIGITPDVITETGIRNPERLLTKK